MGVAVPDLASLTNNGVFNPQLLQNWFTSSTFTILALHRARIRRSFRSTNRTRHSAKFITER
jgi:hypothetical protein